MNTKYINIKYVMYVFVMNLCVYIYMLIIWINTFTWFSCSIYVYSVVCVKLYKLGVKTLRTDLNNMM